MRSLIPFLISAVSATYTWKNVVTGGGGGFVPGIVFNPTQKGLAYARTDIGGLYRLNSDDSWTPLTDFANSVSWHDWGVNALATDPIEPARVYIAVGMYTNSWDPSNGSILRSSDYGATWSETVLSFKFGGNQPGRGTGERLSIDPQNNKVLYLAAPSGHGLWKSVDQGVTWNQVTSFTAVGNFVEDPSDTSGYSNDPIGLITVVFDPTSALVNGVTSRIFVGVGTITGSSMYVSNDGGATWSAPAGQPSGQFPHRMKLSTAEKALYISYDDVSGPYDAGNGMVYRYNIATGVFTNITPSWETTVADTTFGYGGLAIDVNNPGVVMVASDNLWYPDAQIFRSNNSGASWTNIWDYNDNYYTYTATTAPWIVNSGLLGGKTIGWMIAALEIDPFDSNHWLWGTGLTLNGGHNLKSWPNVAVGPLAVGIEECAVQDLICPPGGAPLLSAVGDDSGFVHKSLTVPPTNVFTNNTYSTTPSLDYAGLYPLKIVRIGNSNSDGFSEISLSADGGNTWAPISAVSSQIYGGKVAYGADATSIVWRTATEGSLVFTNGVQGTAANLPTDALLKADKVNPNYYYAVDQNAVYVSSNKGVTFTAVSGFTGYGSPNDIKVHPTIAGDVWISTSNGLYHSTNFGSTFTATTAITYAGAIALGKGSGSYLNIYGFVQVSGGTESLQMSADKGLTWTSIQIPTVGFGASTANCLAASMDTAGLVFVGTNGRGIFYGTGTATGSSTTTSKASSTSTTTAKPSSTSSVKTTSSTKSTLSTSTTKTTSSVTSTSTAALVPAYGQCGGTSWTGGTVCVAGYTCNLYSVYYSQCIPS